MEGQRATRCTGAGFCLVSKVRCRSALVLRIPLGWFVAGRKCLGRGHFNESGCPGYRELFAKEAKPAAILDSRLPNDFEWHSIAVEIRFGVFTRKRKKARSRNPAPLSRLSRMACYLAAAFEPSPQKAGPLIEGYWVTALAAAVRLS